MFCFHPTIIAISMTAVMGKCFIDREYNAIKKCFKRNSSIFKMLHVLSSKALFMGASRYGRYTYLTKVFLRCFAYEIYIELSITRSL